MAVRRANHYTKQAVTYLIMLIRNCIQQVLQRIATSMKENIFLFRDISGVYLLHRVPLCKDVVTNPCVVLRNRKKVEASFGWWIISSIFTGHVLNLVISPEVGVKKFAARNLKASSGSFHVVSLDKSTRFQEKWNRSNEFNLVTA